MEQTIWAISKALSTRLLRSTAKKLSPASMKRCGNSITCLLRRSHDISILAARSKSQSANYTEFNQSCPMKHSNNTVKSADCSYDWIGETVPLRGPSLSSFCQIVRRRTLAASQRSHSHTEHGLRSISWRTCFRAGSHSRLARFSRILSRHRDPLTGSRVLSPSQPEKAHQCAANGSIPSAHVSADPTAATHFCACFWIKSSNLESPHRASYLIVLGESIGSARPWLLPSPIDPKTALSLNL